MFLSFLGVHIDTYAELLWVLLFGPQASPSKTITKPQESSGITKPPPLFALVIGINTYESLEVDDLQGCVLDANSIRQYLEEELKVPSSQIRNLRDKEATRVGIIRGFRELSSDPRIKPGDPILIFYAGHGGETEAPTGWEAGDPESMIQMLIPHDFQTNINGREVHGIPDRTIGTLLDLLAKEKGDNITVIFDCCHSGSGTRTNEFDPTRLLRVTKVPPGVPADLDKDIWHGSTTGRGTNIAPGFLQSGLRSHVLLAACGAKETAKEDKERGVFTKALLETLATVGADRITYTDLLQRMHKLPEQNPQCEGYNRNRILFNSRAPSQGQVFYAVRQDGDTYVLDDAGAAHGITNGAEFAVYRDRDSSPTSSPLGILVAVETSAFSTVLDVPSGAARFALAQPSFVLQTKAGVEEDLRLHVAMDERLIGVFKALAQEMQKRGPEHRSILLVEKDKAEMDIALEGDHVIFNILNTLVTKYGLNRIPFRVSPNVDDVYPVIRATAHYHWHLRRTNQNQTLQNKVRIEFTKVKQVEDEWDEDFKPVIHPEGPNLNVEGVVDLAVDKKSMYGIKIINDTSLKLYPSLFFFDNSNLSIESYYQPPAAGKFELDAPLGPKGSLAIGYGSGGAAPFNYSLRDGQDVDVGFLKLFLTTKPVDYSNVPQASPFKQNGRGGETVQLKTISTWDTVLVTVVQRRARV